MTGVDMIYFTFGLATGVSAIWIIAIMRITGKGRK